LETQRVWDYAGDTYVHRLIRNRADGKVVELPSGPLAGPAGGGQGQEFGVGGGEEEKGKGKGPGAEDAQVAEKMEAMGVEYGLLLSAQLETQRTWYEERMEDVERRLMEALQAQSQGDERVRAEREGQREEEGRVREERERRERAERKALQVQELAKALQRELASERAVSKGLMDNLALAREREEQHAREKEQWEGRMREMEDQLRDVMIFLQARERIESGQVGEEVQGGSVELPPTPTPKAEDRNGSAKKKRTPKR